jgi:spore coat protein U-like protein
MTSTVKITAHCADTKEVQITLDNGNNTGETFVLRDTETKELYVYDARSITVCERLREPDARGA